MPFWTKPVAVCGLVSVFFIAPATAEAALTVTSQGTDATGNFVYQIDFDPITFVSNNFSNSGFGFIVEDFFQTEPLEFGTASSGSLNVNTLNSAGTPIDFTDNGSGGQRGTLGLSTGFGRTDLLVSTGTPLLFGFGDGVDVTISATDLQFTSSVEIPDFADGTYDAILVDNFGRLLSDAVSIEVTGGGSMVPIPLPPAFALGLLAAGALGLYGRRQRRAAQA